MKKTNRISSILLTFILTFMFYSNSLAQTEPNKAEFKKYWDKANILSKEKISKLTDVMQGVVYNNKLYFIATDFTELYEGNPDGIVGYVISADLNFDKFVFKKITEEQSKMSMNEIAISYDKLE